MSTLSKHFLLFPCASLKPLLTPAGVSISPIDGVTLSMFHPTMSKYGMHIASCVSSFGYVCRCKLIMTGRWLGRASRFPLISRKWNAACGCTPLASPSRLNLLPLLDLPCSVLVQTRRLERCQTVHAPIFGCVAVLVHSVDSGLMHGIVNKPPKSAILVCKATWWLFVCLILIHTSMFILWTNTSLLFLPFFPLLLSLGLRFSLVFPHCLLLPNTPS